MKSKIVRGIDLTSPMGRGRRVAPGEGFRPIESPYPLTPTLSPWEREHAAVSVTLVVKTDSGRGAM